MRSHASEKISYSSSSGSSSDSEEDTRSTAEIEENIKLIEKQTQESVKKLREAVDSLLAALMAQPEKFEEFTNLLKSRIEIEFENHRLMVFEEIPQDELIILSELLKSFPYTMSETWPVEFEKLNVDNISEKLLHLAGNARDKSGRSIIGIAAEHGDPKLLQKLINIGGNLDAQDIGAKTVIYWAIRNKLSRSNKNSYAAAEVVNIILNNGIDIAEKCNGKATPLQYVQKHGYIAASSFIEEKLEREKAYTQGAVIGLFQERLITEISTNIASFFKRSEVIASSLTCQNAYQYANNKASLVEKDFSLRRKSSPK